MGLKQNNFVIGVAILLAFIGVGVFGLLPFSHESGMETPMTNCPYTEGGFAVCENTLDHIAGWQQFSHVISSSVFVLLVLAGFLYLILRFRLGDHKRHLYRLRYCLRNEILDSYREDIIKWLSLFENSPSFSYVRHS